MDQDTASVWKKVLAEIETEVSRGVFVTLFKSTSLLSFEKNTASIAAPSNMVIDILQKRHINIIKNALEKHTKESAKIVFVPKVVDKKRNGEIKSAPLFDIVNEPVRTPEKLSRVRPDYTFQNLAVSSTNQLAFVSATTVAQKLGSSYNPLFIYGPVGVGKTHLMQAIANEVHKNHPEKRIIYTTSEEFTNEVVSAIRSNDTARMKKRFRNTHLLMVDDVQFFEGKERAQEELFHTFNILVDEGSQIVLSSDRPPFEIKKLERRLSSRFAGGLTVDIESPDFELKTAILLIKAKKRSISLPIEIAKKIAEKAKDSRQLEGLLLQAVSLAKEKGSEITTELVDKSSLGSEKEQSFFRPDQIIKQVCFFYNIKETAIKGPKREASLVKARQILMFILKNEVSLSFKEIGNLLGGRDHTTIMHGVEKIEKLVEKHFFSEEILGIKQRLKNLSS